jgi:uncharacterized protein YaeQ
MATGSTICRASLTVSDMDRHHYYDYSRTIARHPSETDWRMMIRIAAFCLHADERLEFTRGLCVEDEPELWQKDYSGDIDLWIELGQPDEKRIRKACGRAERVVVYAYQEKSARDWWKQHGGKFRRFENLEVIFLHTDGLEALAERSMELQATVADGELDLHDAHNTATVRQERWQ